MKQDEKTARLDEIQFDTQGLVVAIAQDHQSREILMVAYMTQATLTQTLNTGIMTYWSRSRQCVWIKGETSGQLQEVQRVFTDCDGDALVFEVVQRGGGACHTGARSCFHRQIPL